MSISFARQALNSFLALAACAVHAGGAPWYEGSFRGAADAGAESQMAVTCRPGQPCEVTAARAGGQPKPVEIPIQAPPRLLDPEIANNNWEITRRAVASRPDWYADSSFGPLLKPLRPALESGVRFAECADVDGTGYLALCSLAADREATQGVMLLVNTMNPSCGALPFCAYYFVPLQRVPDRSR